MEHHQEHHKENLALIGDNVLENCPKNKKLEINFPLNKKFNQNVAKTSFKILTFKKKKGKLQQNTSKINCKHI
jgi:hypothetical protein